MQNQQMLRKRESGNVLFLILIAVALFAALSYAVTQSTRSGSGSTDREQSILSGASMTQYPTALRTAVIRMVLGGFEVGTLEFEAPAETEADFPGDPTNPGRRVRVFDNEGGGALYQEAPIDLVTTNTPVPWVYNMNFQVPNLGTTQNELIAFLPGVTTGICVQVNREFNIDTVACTNNDGVPTATLTSGQSDELDITMDSDYIENAAGNVNAELITSSSCTNGNAFAGQASGCFYDGEADRNVFYSVLLER